MCGQLLALLLAALVLLVPRWINAYKDLALYRFEFEGLKIHKDVSDEYYRFYLGRIGLTTRSVNRTFVLNANFTQKKDLPKNAWVNLIAYEQKANLAYSMIPVTLYHGTYCDLIKKDKFFYQDLASYSNFPEECPPPKGDYYVRDYFIKRGVLPPELPGEHWMLDFEIKTRRHGVAIFKWSFYVFINRNL